MTNEEIEYKYVIAKVNIVCIYGKYNKAKIVINKRQKWRVAVYPTLNKPYYTLIRYNVAIQVLNDDYITMFKEV